ncbi:MAG: hypothetical protein IT467_02690 [Dokdonella sp.]|uniref:hypothetical protein n=1 Tax=Dokdonella sp. TaxID=2291710 RepID=UPI0025C6B074|nr:hypothetical protein [Dokdonella sp.]MBZ0223787.1 hypothetical protein [Dokdonella sp.]MCC7254819.1 hypothetical protein [Dokdonella sp.]
MLLRTAITIAVSGLSAALFVPQSQAAGPVTATINLTTVDGKNCTVTTEDPDGLHLESNGTSLMASLATLSGNGCGTGGGTGGANPPTTPFVLTPSPNPLIANVNQPFTVSWTLAGGAAPISCSGAFTGAPTGAVMSNWVQSAPAVIGANSRQVTPVAADQGGGTSAVTFSLTLTCSNADGAITSAAIPITINPVNQGGGDNCPNPQNRLTNANLCYFNVNKSCTNDSGADNLTTFPMWLGRYSPGAGTILPAAPPYMNFPGPTGAGPTFSIGQNQYISAKLDVPTTALSGKIGSFIKAFGNISNYTNADFSISPACGDFENSSMPVACKATNITNDETGIRWIIDGTMANRCTLTRGQTYYLNVRPNGCQNPTCQLRIDG